MSEIKTKTDYLDISELTSAVAAVDSVLAYAAHLKASDIHLDPLNGGTFVRLRVDGKLESLGIITANIHDEVISRLKILSGARTDVHSVPQDGRFMSDIESEKYNLRVSFMPTYHGENAVVRLLSKSLSSLDSFAGLGFTPDHVSMLERSLRSNSGLILAVGPTGSGKTTTLRVCLGLKGMEPISVMTLEDPVEYEIPGVRQVNIRSSYGVTFASGLRSALRQDPDVIMVGEMRDQETSRTAISTALTGHLVLSTMHTTSAIGAITRLLDMGIENYLIASTLRLVVSQRLVRSVCHECGAGVKSECVHCRGTGFKGRSVIAEVLELDDKMRDLILRRESPKSLSDYAISRGFRPISQDSEEKVEWGVTTREEAFCALNT